MWLDLVCFPCTVSHSIELLLSNDQILVQSPGNRFSDPIVRLDTPIDSQQVQNVASPVHNAAAPANNESKPNANEPSAQTPSSVVSSTPSAPVSISRNIFRSFVIVISIWFRFALISQQLNSTMRWAIRTLARKIDDELNGKAQIIFIERVFIPYFIFFRITV